MSDSIILSYQDIGIDRIKTICANHHIDILLFPQWMMSNYSATLDRIPNTTWAGFKFPNKESYTEFCLKWLG